MPRRVSDTDAHLLSKCFEAARCLHRLQPPDRAHPVRPLHPPSWQAPAPCVSLKPLLLHCGCLAIHGCAPSDALRCLDRGLQKYLATQECTGALINKLRMLHCHARRDDIDPSCPERPPQISHSAFCEKGLVAAPPHPHNTFNRIVKPLTH